ncbi:MAG TPA: HAD family hydrolase [Kineosporiaceae bacterium]
MIEDRPAALATPVLDRSVIDAVTFDIGGVFTIRHHEAVRALMGPAGFALPEAPQPYHRAHHVAIRAMSDLLTDAGSVREHDRRTWAYWERGYLRSLGVPEHRLDEAVQSMITAISGTEVKNVWRHVLAENVQGFHRIIASGMPVAVVSNNNGTAEEQLRHFGICQVGPGPLPSVTIVVDSERVGVAKPDPAIFRPALEALGTTAARTLYVGDTVHADVHGATAAGMPAVQLDPYDLHADFDHARLPDVGALADLLLA